MGRELGFTCSHIGSARYLDSYGDPRHRIDGEQISKAKQVLADFSKNIKPPTMATR
jgi:hypothetical protein